MLEEVNVLEEEVVLDSEVQPASYAQKRYFGTPANFRYQVNKSGVEGQWKDHPAALYYQLENGGGLFWYPKDSSIELLGASEKDKKLLLQVLPALSN